MTQITYDYFEKVDIHIGKITQVEDFSKARKAAYKLWIDFGMLGVKKSSAQITELYSKDELKDKLIIAVVNFSPRQISLIFSLKSWYQGWYSIIMKWCWFNRMVMFR